jgi:hypothetical protein
MRMGVVGALAVLAALAAAGDSGGGAPRVDTVLALDGRGGTWCAWSARTGVDGGHDLWLTRLDAAGRPAAGWSAEGIGVCRAADDQTAPVLLPDAREGVWVAWTDRRDGGRAVFLTRVMADGRRAPGFPDDGLRAGRVGLEGFHPVLAPAPDGAWVAWQAWKVHESDIVVQRIRRDGRRAPGWPEAGATVADTPFDECLPQWRADGVLSWTAYDGPDPRVGQVRAARWAGDAPAPVWRGDAAGVEADAGR